MVNVQHVVRLTMLVGLTNEFYRCMNCGADLHQHVNGKISYLPVMTSPKMVHTFCKRMERWLNKVLNSLHLVINLRNVGLVNIKNLNKNLKNVQKKNKIQRPRVDNILNILVLGYERKTINNNK